MSKTIIMTVGLPASGKTTWAKEELQKHPGKFKRVNKDDIRSMADNSAFSFDNEKFVLAIRDKIVEKSLNDGFSVIVDDTNFPPGGKHYLRMCEIAQKVGDVSVIEKYFDVTLKEALLRNSKRPLAVPDGVIQHMYDKHIKNTPFSMSSNYFPPVQTGSIVDTGLPFAVISDIDGTLAIRGDRSSYDWHKVGVDTVNEPVAELFRLLPEKYVKIIVSGRDRVCEAETRQWLALNDIDYNYLFMRPEGDNRKDVFVKEEIYRNNIEGKYNVVWVLDDRDQVVELWRRLGICCLQVNWGDF